MRPTPMPPRRRGAPHRRIRPGLVLRRDPRAWWAAVLFLALVAGGVVASSVARADRVRQQWGTTEVVLVARHDLAPGDPVREGDVTRVARPVAVIPPSALHALPRHATTAVVLAGEILVSERLSPVGLRGTAALLPAGTRAVAIPRDAGTTPPLTVGDHVEVLVALPPESAGGGPPGFALVSDALVVAVDDTAVTVAVPRDSAPRVAVALGLGSITLALIGA